jgi:signal transduction histidine kinase
MAPLFHRAAARRRSARPRVALLIVLTTLPLLLLTALIAWRGARDAESRVEEDRHALAEAAALTVSSWLDAHMASLQTVARTPDITDPYNRPDLPGFLSRTLTDHPEWESIDIFGPQGLNIASTSAAPGSLSLPEEVDFEQAIAGGKASVSAATLSPRSGRTVIVLTVPVDFFNGTRGALSIHLLTVRLNDVLHSVRKSERGQLALVDREGKTFAGTRIDVQTSLPSRRGRPETDAVLSGKSGTVRTDDEDGTDALIAYAPITSTGWGILAAQPISVAFGPARRQLTEQVALLGMVAILTGMIGWYFGSRLSRSYEREVEALARAEDAGRLRDEFLSAASHDLKNPLTAIKALAQLMKRRADRSDSSDAEWYADGLSSIDSSSTRMINQINELMDMARLQTDRPLELNFTTVDLVALANTVAGSQHPRARSRIRVEADGPLVGEFDRARMERVLDNLIGNAVKYSPNGGEVLVKLSRESGPAGDWAILAVSDTGLGIPSADLPHVFERFHRARNVVGKVAGTGIGLAGVRQIVEQHEGSITVASKEGVGSTFTVRLPLSPPTPEEEATPDATVEPKAVEPVSGGRVL